MDIEWRNVDVELINKNKNKNTKYVKLVTNANGIVKAGSLCAIMGPSGSGKTTLIKALVGHIPPGSKTSGEILASGQPRNYEYWSKTIGYVDQDDCMYEELDVKETVTYAAKFRLKDPIIDIDKKVENILEELDIQDISRSKMNSISGGERKRVMIAIELVTEPKILFIDEPTSGLDSSTAYSFVNLMKKLSTTYKMSVIFTIHQPSEEIFNIFDQLILLSDSNTVFSGEAKNAEEYFESYGFKKRETSTFPDFLADILKVKKKYREFPENQDVMNKMIAECDKKYPKSKKMQVSDKNIISVGYLPNFKHILIILHRRCKVNMTIKKIISTLVALGFSFYIFYKIAILLLEANVVSNTLVSFINAISDSLRCNKLDDFSNSLKNHGYNIAEVFKTPLVMNFISTFFSYSMIPSTGLFSQEYKQVKRELGVATYSIGSYYIASFLFELLFYLPFFILSGVLLFIMAGSIIAWEFYLFLILGIFAYLPVIFFFGSLSKRTKTTYVIVGFLALVWFIPPTIYSSINILCQKTENKSLKTLNFISALFPPIHFNSLCVALSYWFRSSASEYFKSQSNVKSICDEFSKYLYSYLFGSMAIWHILVLFVMTTIIYLALSFLALTLRLKPDLRFKLSK